MKMKHEVIHKLDKFYKCQSRIFSLKNSKSGEILAETCICGSPFCFLPCEILNGAQNNNKSQLFLQYKEDAETVYYSRRKLSNVILVPAAGERHRNQFQGYCYVCHFPYPDYLSHI